MKFEILVGRLKESWQLFCIIAIVLKHTIFSTFTNNFFSVFLYHIERNFAKNGIESYIKKCAYFSLSRHAALMAISAVGEGCHKQMQDLLPQIMDGVIQYLQDPVSI